MSVLERRTPCPTTTAVVAVLLAASVMAAACGSSGRSAKSTRTSTSRSAQSSRPTSRPTSNEGQAVTAFGQLERQYGATLGVYALDTGTGTTVTYHADQRFAFCSTYKALAAGVLLGRDTDAQLTSVITYSSSDLQAYSPITSQHVATGMSLDAVISAALQYSDNTAANLLLAQMGGPSGLQRDLRRIGDETTNVDRDEPAVNTATPGDLRDTSTARALATDLRRFALGRLLTPARTQHLIEQLRGNTTGGPLIRAGVPAGWVVGDKTGTGDYGTHNDIAVVWPPHGDPIVIALLSNRSEQNSTSQDALLADVTKVIVADIG